MWPQLRLRRTFSDDGMLIVALISEPRRRRNLFQVSNGHNELPEMRFEFPFKLIGFFNRPIMARTQILVHDVGANNKDFGAVLQTDLTRT